MSRQSQNQQCCTVHCAGTSVPATRAAGVQLCCSAGAATLTATDSTFTATVAADTASCVAASPLPACTGVPAWPTGQLRNPRAVTRISPSMELGQNAEIGGTRRP